MADSGPDRWELLGMGTTLAGCFLVPMALGWAADHFAGTLPIFIMVGLVLGIVSAGWYGYKQANKFFGSGHE